MTLIVTHAAGFLACFTRNPDGTMKQRALIDTGEEPPTAIELANIGERFAREYGWNGTEVSVPRVKVTKAKAPKALQSNRRYNVNDPPVPERKAMIVKYLATHPESSLREIVEGLGFEYDISRYQRWHFQMKELVAEGTLLAINGANRYGKVIQYLVM